MYAPLRRAIVICRTPLFEVRHLLHSLYCHGNVLRDEDARRGGHVLGAVQHRRPQRWSGADGCCPTPDLRETGAEMKRQDILRAVAVIG